MLRTAILFLATCLFTSSAAWARDNVLMLVDSNLYSQTSTAINQYKADVEANFAVTLTVRTGSFESQTPEQIRSFIQNEYTTNHITGVVLTGQIPYAGWTQNQGANTGYLSAFYEDLDGGFQDTNGNGIYDYHTWGTHQGPEIWSCWMRPPTAGGQAADLNTFLAKTHAYYAAGMPVPQQSLLAGHSDYDGFMEGPQGSIAWSEKMYGAGNYDTSGRGTATSSATQVNNYLTHNQYALFESSSHAGSDMLQYDSGYLVSQSAYWIPAGEGALYAAIYGCHSADFAIVGNQYGSPGTTTTNINIAVAFPFGSSIAQAASGTSWSYGTEDRELVYAGLDRGEYLGQAWYRLIGEVDTPGHIEARYPGRDIYTELAGNDLIGNPFIRLSVPEPASLSVLALGLLGVLRRRRQ